MDEHFKLPEDEANKEAWPEEIDCEITFGKVFYESYVSLGGKPASCESAEITVGVPDYTYITLHLLGQASHVLRGRGVTVVGRIKNPFKVQTPIEIVHVEEYDLEGHESEEGEEATDE